MTVKSRETTGWLATCACGAGEPVAALVIDAAGDVVVREIAEQLGRRYLGGASGPVITR